MNHFQNTAIGGIVGVAVLAIATLFSQKISIDALSEPTIAEDYHFNKYMPEVEQVLYPWQHVKPSGMDYFGTAGDQILNEMKTENIENYLRYLTSQGNMAGTKQDLEQAQYIRDLWQLHGLDQAYIHPYNVQLSHPDPSKHNKVYLLDDESNVKFTSSVMETPTDGVAYDESIPPAFLAFSPAGTINTNKLVFVNFGRYEDFKMVQSMGIEIKDCLVIAKFGKIFRGDKVKNAERFNASGIILYTDPEEYNPETDNGGPSYPNSYWLPGSGIQRGSIIWQDGDPTTPDYPSLDGINRLSDGKTNLPNIPAHTLSFNDARKILVNMGGPEVPDAWKGRLNITYRLGPHMARDGWTVKLEVNNKKRVLATSNVIGVIRGSEEPDRYVILGNHRDSWVFGSCDPSSGTAVQMELARVLGKMLKTGWRPRRSIVLGSWGAGEFGFFGATEWVEEYLKIFEMRAVAHLNIDLALFFPYNIQISATPMLHKIIKEATKRTPAPDPSLGYKTVWDHWNSRARAASPALLNWNLGSISDHAPFYQNIGVPTSYMVWGVNYDEVDWSDYPLYHTTFEDFNAMKTFLDPEFRYHLSIGQLWGLMTIGLADSQILPMDPEDETTMLEEMINDIQTRFGDELVQRNITLAPLISTVDRFSSAAIDFNNRLKNGEKMSPLYARQLNDQLMLLEKCYINSKGSSSRPHMKNMVFGTNNFDQYSGWTSPGVKDAMWEALECQRQDCTDEWDTVAQQISLLHYVIHSAVLALKDIETL